MTRPLSLRPSLLAPLAAALLLAACGDTAKLPADAGIGPAPKLPAPHKTLLPTVKIAPAVGWTDTAGPTPAEGFAVTALARGLDHPRTVYTLPNGDVLVVESNKPPKPEGSQDGGSGLFAQVRAKVMGMVQKRAGAGVPSANRITLLRDADNDGVAEVRQVFMQNLVSPFGVVLVGNELFVANADALVKVPYAEGQTAITATPVKVTDLPAGINHHWTKHVVANREGTKLYVSVGSNSNVAENGMEAEEGRAAIWEVDVKSGEKRLFASGLRNPTAMAWEPDTQVLWTVVNERDELGSDLVPDYLTSVKDGAFYGWPWSYFGGYVDARVNPQRPDMVAKAVVPDYALGSHHAPLGIAFSSPRGMPPEFASGAFIGEHGSWNRNPLAGYKVVFVPFIGGRPSGAPVDVLTGFLNADEKAQGRPVGVALDKGGALLVADDVGNAVWKLKKK
ncbi:sorbosone dehydrogenase family protein [Variovorax sp. J22R187]|uniref:PQQ-dependent sugar dehydrogenase n=1 Tax=Variovorax saccharolyticus TaxID=3053516 RepID=UPI0025780B6D|nr:MULTISPECIES: sorbosone dehydrogenase family protein [unclassified Variovorax]MDM0019627.1 sorbosone dehydrogenase family protein [Variovorax sp. J22R187]MDM0027779.1 sorbosone dehydrogenase family protein [Variovorax sp. J31P216]